MMINSLDAHGRPPDSIKRVYKRYQKLTLEANQSDPTLLDFHRGLTNEQQCKVRKVDSVPSSLIKAACSYLGATRAHTDAAFSVDLPVYETDAVPGLFLIPALIPEHTQLDLISRLLHRDLADQRHRTNVHLHHLLPYQAIEPSNTCSAKGEKVSFFSMSSSSPEYLAPIDRTTHKALTISQFLNRKLRWMTLGGQYNWTEKKYPAEKSPSFPADIAGFVHHLFPDIKPEAAILNVYTPGDTLSVHRDVSEESDTELVSISFGCDGIFIIALGSENSENSEEPECVVVRLHSGDAVVMSGPARFAWHGIPQVIRNSCPVSLGDWPAVAHGESKPSVGESPYEDWRGWMSNKRLNLNIRQMRD